MSRPKVGNRVKITKEHLTNGHVGEYGILTKDDESSVPYEVKLENSDYDVTWCCDCEIANNNDTMTEEKKEFERGDKIRIEHGSRVGEEAVIVMRDGDIQCLVLFMDGYRGYYNYDHLKIIKKGFINDNFKPNEGEKVLVLYYDCDRGKLSKEATFHLTATSKLYPYEVKFTDSTWSTLTHFIAPLDFDFVNGMSGYNDGDIIFANYLVEQPKALL